MQADAEVLDGRHLATLLKLPSEGPLHRQLESGLRGLIRSGEVTPGAVLPGEHELAAVLGLSRHTVRHALGVLAAEGLLIRERGRGTRVSNGAHTITERTLGSFYAFAWEAGARGLEARSVIVEQTVGDASADLVHRLGLADDLRVVRIVRVRTAGGEPLVLESAHFPAAIAEHLDQSVLEHGSLYDAIEQLNGLRITGATETIRPTVLSTHVARLLSVRSGSPAFMVERTTWAGERAIEWQESLVRGDRFLYSVELPRLA